ncbi:MAG TPA: MFS transporter [Actinomycetota bacterium]
MSIAKLGEASGRWVVAASVLGSVMSFVDGTAVNVALKAIGAEFGGAISGLQWVVDAYLLTLSGFIMLGGSLGDLYGRRRVFVIGVIGFAGFSLLCGIAPTLPALIGARALQGVSAALLMPGSLAIITAVFDGPDRGRAIGLWTGFTGIAAIIGPFLGGALIDAGSWRLVFLINAPIAAAAVFIAGRRVPETRDESTGRHPDLAGALLAALGLGGAVYALIEGPVRGWSAPEIVAAGVLGGAGLVAFVVVEAARGDPMLPLAFFRNRTFSGANLATLAIYGALSASLFFIVLQLQVRMAYSATLAGSTLIPVTAIMFVLSPAFGRMAGERGPRLFMTVGPAVAAAGLWLYGRVLPGRSFWESVLPASIVFGIGLSVTVAPLTNTVLSALESRHAGIASAVNNAVARLAGLIAIAVVPLAVGIAGAELEDLTASAFQRATLISALVCLGGALISAVTIRDETVHEPASSP